MPATGTITYRSWVTDHVVIHEIDWNYALHAFACFHKHTLRYLGAIVPATLDEMTQSIHDLTAGVCPICDQWEDGAGVTVSLNGWDISS
jgi:hypothetical protein